MGHCRYTFNSSELYRRTKPGQGVEVSCGALTFPAVDDPEIVPVRVQTPGSAEASYTYLPTGRMLARATDDPYCPAHGGSPEPPPPPVTLAELQSAHDAYLALAARFSHDESPMPALTGVPMPALSEAPAGAQAGEVTAPVTADQLQAASEALAALAARANDQGVSDGQ